MNNVLANILIVAMSATYFLLAAQAEIVTKTLGIIFGSLLVLALLAQFAKKAKNDA